MYKTLMVGIFLLIGFFGARSYPYDTVTNSVAQIPSIERIYEYENFLLSLTPDDPLPDEQEKVIVQVNPKERECLAKAIYWEARNQSLDGKVAVGFVVINRVNAGLWKDTVCGVVYQGCQFSWVCDGKAKRNLYKLKNEDEKIAWAEAIALANELLMEYNDLEDVTKGATFFHAHYVKPDWSRWKKVERTVRIDDHIFYRLRSM
jgi:spore germination cell wall hydrolase CwlJ-like protein